MAASPVRVILQVSAELPSSIQPFCRSRLIVGAGPRFLVGNSPLPLNLCKTVRSKIFGKWLDRIGIYVLFTFDPSSTRRRMSGEIIPVLSSRTGCATYEPGYLWQARFGSAPSQTAERFCRPISTIEAARPLLGSSVGVLLAGTCSFALCRPTAPSSALISPRRANLSFQRCLG